MAGELEKGGSQERKALQGLVLTLEEGAGG